MPIPTPPPDNSGGYFIIQYTNGQDLHKARLHVRDFAADGSFTSPSSTAQPNVPAEAAKYMDMIKYHWGAGFVLSLDSIHQKQGDGTFTELFGWTAPATRAGTNGSGLTTDQERASMGIWNFRDSFGGRMRLAFIGVSGFNAMSVPVIVSGAAGGTDDQKLVDYLTTASKTNIVSRNGHVVENPARVTFCINARLRRHYGYA